MDTIFFWNIRGLGNSSGRLKSLIKKFNVDLFAISEPFAAEDRMVRLGNLLSYHHFISNEIQGGKLWIFWKDFNAFEVTLITTQMVSGWFVKEGQRILVSFVYAKCSYAERRELWRHLEENQVSDFPWVVLGDFNVIRRDAERIGGSPRPLLSMMEFNDCLHHCGIVDLRNTGQRMSWCNGREGVSRSWAKLDRVLINNAFSSSYGSAHFKYLSRKYSDHCPMVVYTDTPFSSYGPSPFRFLNMWCSHDSFLSCVKDAWIRNDSASGLLKLAIRLKRTKVALRAWNKNVFGRVGENIQALEERMELLENQLQSGFSEEVEADYLTTKLEIQNFLSESSEVEACDISGLIQRQLSNDDNDFLCSIPTEEEVKRAVFSIPMDSSPGPDGFGSEFYMSCWDIVKDDVMDAAVDFFQGTPLSRFYSSSFIVLIPKVDNPASFDKFRPISLCSVAYKIFSKIIVFRLTDLVEKLVSHEQGAFIPRRSIFENITLAQEMVHSLHKKMIGDFFKAKYCRHDHILVRKGRPTDSRFWRSMVAIIPEVVDNIKILVRGGNSSFWFDRWLASGPLSVSTDDISNKKMCIKDCWLNNNWNSYLLVELVGDDKSKDIVNNVAAGRRGQDISIWKPASDGTFSTSSAWETVRRRGDNFVWKDWFWHSLLPKRISICIWKAWFMCLAVDDRVKDKGISMASACDCCVQRSQETIDHVLSVGDVAADIWCRASVVFGIPFQRVLPWKNRVTNWFYYARKSSIKGVLIGLLPCLITWCLWNRRCKARMEGVYQGADQIWRSVRYWVRSLAEDKVSSRDLNSTDFFIMKELQIQHHKVFARPGKFFSWTKPPAGWIKLNCDGSCRGNPGNSGGGGVIRDCHGMAIAAFSSFFGNGTNNSAELKAILEGIRLCKRLLHFNVIIESDSRIVVDWLRKGRCSLWYLWDFWEDLVVELVGVNFRVFHQYREGNSAADFLAKEGARGTNIFYDDQLSLPRFLHGVLRIDRLGLPYFRH
ncbi:hypothetical protein LWI29_035797 [Acer saccharum]|uniref:RNase H type-1 domain-containing protein n=1 Tax=Acer saccharum TaxID=4024 RepID=A0AA39VA98_ACESA|nr:hypothetical protein LWI29_035797 [Acer saccharum]